MLAKGWSPFYAFPVCTEDIWLNSAHSSLKNFAFNVGHSTVLLFFCDFLWSFCVSVSENCVAYSHIDNSCYLYDELGGLEPNHPGTKSGICSFVTPETAITTTTAPASVRNCKKLFLFLLNLFYVIICVIFLSQIGGNFKFSVRNSQ